MIIDNKRNKTITNYRGKKLGRKAVDSDHVTFILNINLNILPQKQQRMQMLDFKNAEGQAIFKRKATETNEFTQCFENMLPLLEQCEEWFHTLKAHFKKSYPTIRIRNKNIRSSGADSLITQRKKLKQDIEDGKLISEEDFDKLEEDIANIINLNFCLRKISVSKGLVMNPVQ